MLKRKLFLSLTACAALIGTGTMDSAQAGWFDKAKNLAKKGADAAKSKASEKLTEYKDVFSKDGASKLFTDNKEQLKGIFDKVKADPKNGLKTLSGEVGEFLGQKKEAIQADIKKRMMEAATNQMGPLASQLDFGKKSLEEISAAAVDKLKKSYGKMPEMSQAVSDQEKTGETEIAKLKKEGADAAKIKKAEDKQNKKLESLRKKLSGVVEKAKKEAASHEKATAKAKAAMEKAENTLEGKLKATDLAEKALATAKDPAKAKKAYEKAKKASDAAKAAYGKKGGTWLEKLNALTAVREMLDGND